MSLHIFKKRPLLWLYIAGGLLLVVALLVWCCKLSMDPERVFWNTIERGLASKGVTIESRQTDTFTITRYSFGAQTLSHSITKLRQQGTTVQNEMISTPTADYLRYTGISTDQKKADGSPIDFSKVLNVWAQGEEGNGRFFVQSLFSGVAPVGGLGVPIGNLSPESRAALVKQIHSDHVYEVAFDKVKKERVNGRLQYTYDVAVQPVAYVALMKRFSQEAGLHGLDELDPNAYEGRQAFQLRVTVDAKAQHVVQITAPDTGNTQTYSGYDIPVQVLPPEGAISGAELQQLLSELQ